MRKSKLLLATTMCCVMLFASGCSKNDTKDYSKYVELGQYKGVEVTVDSTDVTDKEVEDQIQSILQSNATKVEVKDRAIKDGDIANIDYVGKIDGKEFTGGSATAFDLTIGSGTFIDDFEQQLIGAKIGDTVEVEVTFPEDYKNDETLAGKDAVFTVTVNGIKEEQVPKLTDEWVTEYTKDSEEPCKTVDEYEAQIRKQMKESKEEQAATNKTADVLTKIVENSKINGYPEDEIEAYIEDMKTYYENFASQYGYDLETFLTSMFGMTKEEFDEEANTLAKETIARQMVCKLIAKAENMTVTDEEYQAGLAEYAKEYSTADNTYTPESFEEQYGKDVITENIILEKVLDFVTDNAVEVAASTK